MLLFLYHYRSRNETRFHSTFPDFDLEVKAVNQSASQKFWELYVSISYFWVLSNYDQPTIATSAVRCRFLLNFLF